MISTLPNDPMMCLSVINTKLRDMYKDLDTLCQEMNIDKEALICKMKSIDYVYDSGCNQFV